MTLDEKSLLASICKTFNKKLAQTLVNESESCISRSVQKLKQNETFRAKLTIAIDNIVEELNK